MMDFGIFSLIIYVIIYACMVIGMNRKISALMLPMIVYSCLIVCFWVWNFLLILAVAFQELPEKMANIYKNNYSYYEVSHVGFKFKKDDILGDKILMQTSSSFHYMMAIFTTITTLLMAANWAVMAYGIVQYRKHVLRSNF